jgi:transposase
MPKFKQGMDRYQELLMPKRIVDCIEDKHLAKLVVSICDALDLSKIEAKYMEIGQHAYDPRVMTAILFYGYSLGIRSSRQLAKACRERLDFVFISKGLKPTHDRISDFRKDNLEELKGLFREIVLVGRNMDLTQMGSINASIDGTKIRANASPKLSKDEEGLKDLLDKTQKQINNILEKAGRIDKKEDRKYGKRNEGGELPKKLQSKESREKAIKEAMEVLRKQKDQMRKDIVEEKGSEPTKTEQKKIEDTKINVTDHDARFMKERQGVIKPNYNAQIAVDEKHQFIVANDVTTECNDHHQLIPMTQKIKDNLGDPPDKIKADNGYFYQLEDATKAFPETVFYVDDKNRRKDDLDLEKIKEDYSEIEYNNLVRLLSDEGAEEYRKRMHTAEPPF